MRNRNIKSLLLASVLLFLAGCWEDELFPGGGKAVPVALQIIAVDAVTSAPEAGATVELYLTLAGYVNETGAAATRVTDAEGKVVFTKEELGDVGAKYFNVISGPKRNWASISSTAVLNMTSGVTTITTKLAAPDPDFLKLAGNRYALTSYYYDYGAGYDIIDPASGYGLPECRTDDEFVFLKTGRIIGYDAGVACTPSHPKGYTVAGFDWSSWAIGTAGDAGKILMKDLDPDWYGTTASNATYKPVYTFSVDESTVTLDYGGGYVAVLTKL